MNNIQYKIKEKLKTLLIEYIEVCEKNGIQYYLIGGSALGAVRRRGFIPWDDDIDVGMPRPDYERFIKCAQKSLPENIFLQTYKTDPGYMNNFVKLRDCNTTFIESSCRNQKINHGIYIDIFPLDGAGNSENDWVKQFRRINWYSRPIAEKFDIACVTDAPMYKKIIKKIAYPILLPSVGKCLEKRDELYRQFSYEDSLYIANYGGAWGKREVVPREYFGEGCEAEFEGLKVIIPEKYDEYLTHVYGDYMTPPPVEKRVAHHYCDVIDTKKSYREYVDY